jgi:hypothetical protein
MQMSIFLHKAIGRETALCMFLPFPKVPRYDRNLSNPVGQDQLMFLDVMRAYPWAFLSTVVFPVVVAIVAIIAAVFSGLAGFETLKGRLASSLQSQRIDDGVSKLPSNDSERQSTLHLLESYNEKITAAGKRDATLAAIINQYQQLSRAAALFGQMSHRDPSPDQGKVASEILKILNQDVVRTLLRDDLPGKPLVIELQPNSFRVIYPVPMRAPPCLRISATARPAR